MSQPFYVAPEQVMKDRADYARKGIARGRSLIGSTYAGGIVICAENTSNTLRKVSEIYDRIGFAGVGKYNEFDQLRIAGVRHADLKGFNYSRADVDARGLANQYASMLGQVFTHEMKPMEVEILVAEIGLTDPERDQFFHILYDGSVTDHTTYVVLGGDADTLRERMSGWKPNKPLKAVVQQLSAALAGEERTFVADDLEVAILERGEERRTFKRIEGEELQKLL